MVSNDHHLPSADQIAHKLAGEAMQLSFRVHEEDMAAGSRPGQMMCSQLKFCERALQHVSTGTSATATLSGRDIASMRPGEFITDTIIDAYTSLLQQLSVAMSATPDIGNHLPRVEIHRHAVLDRILSAPLLRCV